MERTIVHNARVFTGREVIERGWVVVEDDRTADLGAGGLPTEDGAGRDATLIDAAGATLMPGLIDAHMHVLMTDDPSGETLTRELADEYGSDHADNRVLAGMLAAATRLGQCLARGVTSVRDLGGRTDAVVLLRESVVRGVVAGPRMLVAGSILTSTGGIMHEGHISRWVDGVDGMRRVAREQLTAGVDLLKLYTSRGILGPLAPGVAPAGPTLSEEEMHAAVVEAHNMGRRVTGHSQGTDTIKAAVRAGVDCIEHGARLDDEGARMMVDRGVYFVPTMESLENVVRIGEAGGFPAYYLANARLARERHQEAFAFARAAGVTIVTGTDSGAEGSPTHGDVAIELEALVRLGMTATDALKAATVDAAACLGRDAVGEIARGKLADLLLVEGDPTSTIAAVRNVRTVWLGGRVVHGESGIGVARDAATAAMA